MTIADIGSLALAFVTAVSLFYISRQVSITRLQTKGQFLLALDDQFKGFNGITLRLANTSQPFTPASDDWREIWGYMSVFERINIMVEDKILDVALVDRLYGFRLVTILANDDVYQMVKSSGAEWQDFIHLCKAIADHRRKVRVAGYDQAFIERADRLSTDRISPENVWSSRLNP